MPPIYFFLTIGAMVGLHYFFPIVHWIDDTWGWIGWVPIGLGVSLGLMGDVLFRRHDTTIKPYEESSSLVTGGPYRITRNPMYLGMTLILLGIGVLCGTLTPFLEIPLFVALINYRFIRMEEGMLEERFGDEYLYYKTKVRRWI